jgi:hypothetical protein
MVSRHKSQMTSPVLGDWTLESITPSVNAPLFQECLSFYPIQHRCGFTRSVNSLLFHWFPFTRTNEFTQNLMKSFGVQGHLSEWCESLTAAHTLNDTTNEHHHMAPQEEPFCYAKELDPIKLLERFHSCLISRLWFLGLHGWMAAQFNCIPWSLR